jgi:sulfur carrier protein ThiS
LYEPSKREIELRGCKSVSDVLSALAIKPSSVLVVAKDTLVNYGNTLHDELLDDGDVVEIMSVKAFFTAE